MAANPATRPDLLNVLAHGLANGQGNGEVDNLLQRALPQGGFSSFPGGRFCPAATAMALLALPAQHQTAPLGRERICRDALANGLVPISPDHPTAIWPTAPALMALLGQADCARQSQALAQGLLRIEGQHWPVDPTAPTSHDTNLRGWSWTEATHAWAEPTAMAMLALTAAGFGEHQRVLEARSLLMDRQLPGGGWNYGNVRVFGTLLHPDPVNTAAALCALQGRAEAGTVVASLDSLDRMVRGTRAPLTLSWGLLALGAWGRSGLGDLRQTLAEAVAARRDDPVLGPLETGVLALACIALESPDGLAAHLGRRMGHGGSHGA